MLLVHASSRPTTRRTLAGVCAAAAALVSFSSCAVEDPSASGGDSSSESGEKSSYTTAQSNAIRSAKSYLGLGSGFSRAGLVRQLSSKAGDGYKRADAVFAVNHIKVDYKKQAVLSAKAYLEMTGMSRDGLIQQLTSKAGDQYTPAQAAYAADKLGL